MTIGNKADEGLNIAIYLCAIKSVDVYDGGSMSNDDSLMQASPWLMHMEIDF